MLSIRKKKIAIEEEGHQYASNGTISVEWSNSRSGHVHHPFSMGHRAEGGDYDSLRDAAGLVAHSTLAALSADVYRETRGPRLPADWERALVSSDCGLGVDGFGAALYIRLDHGRTVTTPSAGVVAFRGTENVKNMQSDAYLILMEVPLHLQLALQFVAEVRKFLPTSVPLTFTGHSLGACVAACCGYLERSDAIVFDSPGERPWLEKMGHDDFSRARCGHIVSYVAGPNAVNTLHAHVGIMIEVRTLSEQDWAAPVPDPLDAMPRMLRMGLNYMLPNAAKEFAREQLVFLDRQWRSHEMRQFLHIFAEGEPAHQLLVHRWPHVSSSPPREFLFLFFLFSFLFFSLPTM